MSGSYMPSQLANFIQRMSFEKNTRRIVPLNSTALNPGDILTLELCPHAVCDLASFKIYSYANTTGQPAAAGKTPSVCLPRSACALISRQQATSNGQVVSQGPQHHSHLYNILAKHLLGDMIGDRQILNNDSPVPTSDAGYNQTQANNANIVGGLVSNKPLVMSHFIDFLGSSQQVLDTEILPLRMEFTMASPNVLGYDSSNTLSGSQSYSLTGVYATVDVWQLPSDYYLAQARFLQNNGVIDRIYQKWSSYNGSVIPAGQGPTQVTRFNAAYSSMDRVLGTFINTSPTGSAGVYADGTAVDPWTGQSWSLAKHSTGNVDTFTNYGADVATWNFQLNGVLYPALGPVDSQFTYEFLSEALGTHQDAHSIVSTRAVPSNDAFLRSAWVCGVAFALNADPSERLASGVNSLGTTTEITWNTVGATQNKGSITTSDNGNVRTPVLFVQSSSVVRIGANQQFELMN